MVIDEAQLDWIETKADAMRNDVIRWVDINSGSYHLSGLTRMLDALDQAFAVLGGIRGRVQLPPASEIASDGNVIERPLGDAFVVKKRPDARVRVLLNIHYDTVYGPTDPFQRAHTVDRDTCRGPGVVDAKGGIIVMLTALRALERSASAERIGWEVVLNPDEEIGSPGSAALLREAAGRNHLGLVFEPAMRDGSLVGARKGSGNFTAVVRGRAAHAGRDFHLGRSAVVALAELVTRVDAIQNGIEGVTINCGKVEGGVALNIVPDLAIAWFNARAVSPEQARLIESRVTEVAHEVARNRDGITIDLRGGFHAPPKVLDERATRLMDLILVAAREL